MTATNSGSIDSMSPIALASISRTNFTPVPKKVPITYFRCPWRVPVNLTVLFRRLSKLEETQQINIYVLSVILDHLEASYLVVKVLFPRL